ncbi:MAG: penicillin-binding protein 2 [Actinomycetaceae bacterium]|nr:penicillin-binding protein 2 [Actinomycetaceae bacterium]MDY6083032.1 penicillin-binding protein 2 [Actinomycetaceae bacterium]
MASRSDRHPRLSIVSHVRQLPLGVRRIVIVMALVVVCALVLSVRLIDVQAVQGASLARNAADFRTSKLVLHSKRGDILDSTGAVLATSVERYNVAVNQIKIQQYVHYQTDSDGKRVQDASGRDIVEGTGAAEAAKLLAPILKMDQAQLGGLLLGGEQKSTFVYVKKDVAPATWKAISSLNIPGIEPEQFVRRQYPNGAVAGNILGFVGQTADSLGVANGQAGIEKTFDSVLSGKDGLQTQQTADNGTVIPNTTTLRTPAVDGRAVKLTINRDLQNEAQQAIDEAVTKFGAEWGSLVAIEIGTGRVLALADSGTPDPSHVGSISADKWGSHAVQAPVEPGSIGKLALFAAALDTGVVNPTSVFRVPDHLTTADGEPIRDAENHNKETLTTTGILAKSYNTGTVMIGSKLSKEVRYQYLKKFGLGEPTGIELPAESGGILHNWQKWERRENYTTMFGQGYTANVLQIAQMAAIIGNHGVAVPVHIVDAVEDDSGTMVPQVTAEPTQVLNSTVADELVAMMSGVTHKGATAAAAHIPGYNVAGKTGTAQLPDANGNLTKANGSFVGILPAEDPQIAVAVDIYHAPQPSFGGVVAAPAFARFGAFAAQQLRIPLSTSAARTYPWSP